MESNFADIKQKFEAQITQLTNQLSTFENLKQNEINSTNKDLLHFKEELTKEYEKLFEEIKKQHQEELQLAKNFVEEKKTAISNLQILKAKTEHKPSIARGSASCALFKGILPVFAALRAAGMETESPQP